MKTANVSDAPRKAPENFRELEPRVVTSDGDGLWETWHGSGVATEVPCEACGNTQGNLRIYGNSGTSYPNGNSWDDSEILCGACGKFSLIMYFTEG